MTNTFKKLLWATVKNLLPTHPHFSKGNAWNERTRTKKALDTALNVCTPAAHVMCEENRHNLDHAERAGSPWRFVETNLWIHSGHWHMTKNLSNQLLVSVKENDMCYTIQHKMKHFLKSYHIPLSPAEWSPACELVSTFWKTPEGLVKKVSLPQLYILKDFVYEKLTSPSGVSLFQWDSRGPDSVARYMTMH
jgi:hypothetical protein